MKDQVDALKKNGIAVESLDSTKTPEESQFIRVALERGQLQLLYCAPERLILDSFLQAIRKVPGGVRLLVIDEAHCIAEWGRSFRPDYLKVARFAREVGPERVICLTATATPEVAEDLCKEFSIPEDGVFRLSPYRKNLDLHVETVKDKDDRLEKLLGFLETHQGPSLVYVKLPFEAESLAAQLQCHGLDASAYHAQLQSTEKEAIQDQFMLSKNQIAATNEYINKVVSTIAFGMGINKPDIRHVIHVGLPASIEQYSQQIGRAGRDGLTSQCVYYLDQNDFYIQECFARSDLPSKISIRRLLQDIFDERVLDLQVGETFKKNNYTQGQNCDVNQGPLKFIYAALELQFGLIREFSTEYRPSRFKVYYNYYNIMKSDKSPGAKAIKLFAAKNGKLHHLDITEAATDRNIPMQDIKKKLLQLERRGAVSVKDLGEMTEYRVLDRLPHTDEQIEELVDKLYEELEKREEETLGRARELLALVTANKCISLSLAEYVGAGLPDGKQNCGHCSFCLTGKPAVLCSKPTKPLDADRIRFIMDVCDIRDDPRLLAMVAFGAYSPRILKLRLHIKWADRQQIFRSLKDHDFNELLLAFTKACKTGGTDLNE
ncbi:ATP-dependent DNA helicase RecQ [Cladobotryum mycophilum]|uniref:DNA 3'-5' helicase n=1 Tax=Cladobotryum mycophilum TaxID=491253 RepID=A0ABR0S7R9_9HYPO